jgi:hypothetical protein
MPHISLAERAASMSPPSRSSRRCPGSRTPRLKHLRVSPMSSVTCSPTWLHLASRFRPFFRRTSSLSHMERLGGGVEPHVRDLR